MEEVVPSKKQSLTSGYRKRKNKEIADTKLEKELEKTARLTSYFQPKISKESNIPLTSTATLEAQSVSNFENNSQFERNDTTKSSDTYTERKPQESADFYNNSNIELLKNEAYPTDFAHFPTLTTEIKRFVLSTGSCRPKGPFPRDSKKTIVFIRILQIHV